MNINNNSNNNNNDKANIITTSEIALRDEMR